MDNTSDTSLPELASAFTDLPIDSDSSKIGNVIKAMSRTTIALDRFHRNKSSAPAFADIIDARNGAQHMLLSLSPQPDYMSTSEVTLYTVCRISLLIYSNMVIFPLPPVSGVSARLCTALKDSLGNETSSSAWRNAPKLIIWALILGGISDGSDVERPWFINKYVQLSSSLAINTWEQLKQCLNSFLWLGFVLDQAAISFWAESQFSAH